MVSESDWQQEMIHYQLRCSADHEFDGWFRDSTTFEEQVRLNLIECPACGDTSIHRALMAPAIAKQQRTPAPLSAQPQRTPVAVAAEPSPPQVSPEPPQTPPTGAVAGKLPDHVRAMLQRIRSEVEQHCVYVGDRFAEEARRMHRGESDQRGIYGETTPEQAEALADDGIEFSRIPWVPRADG
jgi:hypothetical protein